MTGRGYHNDQFFNLKGESPIRVGNGYKPLVADNPPFVYPENIIRYGDGTSQKLNRGYIRSLDSSQNSAGIRKCQFQFNPATLQQSVSMATGLLNMLQQDPAQWAQPVAASQNFSFTLMFDRSMEINNDKGKIVTGGDGVDVWRQNDPGQVGVLRDLAALFSTIGQGFSSQQRAYIEKVLKDTIKTEASASADTDSATQLTEANKNLTSTGGFLDINIGNSAFLLPVPVRVVFSSLYVVEGLVQNTSVVFTKFSSTMVPMQCTVTVTMEAKYIGFSKQKTFLTDVLAQRAKLQADEIATAAANKQAILSALAGGLYKMRVGVVSDPDRPDQTILASTLFADRNVKYGLGATFPGALPNGSNTAPLSAKQKKISDLFANGSLSLESGARVTIYGPYSTLPIFLPGRASSYVKTHGKVLYAGFLSGSNSIGARVGAGVAQDAASFHVFLQGAGGKDVFAPNADGSTPVSVPPTGKYLIVHYEGKIAASFPGSSIVGSGESWDVIGTDLTLADLEKTFSIKWPIAAVGSNGATKPPAAGATGNGRVTGAV